MHLPARLARRVLARVHGPDVRRAGGRCRLAPEWLVLCVNNFCDLKCEMCDVGLDDRATVFWANLIGDDRRNMSLELFEEILREARAFLPRPRVGLAFTEPLIHPRILEFCGAAARAGVFAAITSNGSMLPRLADRLVEIGLDELNISVDGPPDIHDRIRGRAGSFARLYTGIERVNDARRRLGRGRPVVRLSFTITGSNFDRIVEFLRAVEPLAPASINVSHLNFISTEMAAVHNRTYGGELAVTRSNLGRLSPEEMPVERLWAELVAAKQYAASRGPAFPRLHIVPDAPDAGLVATYYRRPSVFVGGRQCTDPWKLLMIKTDGTVIPAHGRCYNVPVGKVGAEPLAAIWNGPRLRTFRQTLQQAGGSLPACSRCCGVIGKPTATALPG
jgi:MoaA/NifB/PqqE/SkfB family radical SAM enzyme